MAGTLRSHCKVNIEVIDEEHRRKPTEVKTLKVKRNKISSIKGYFLKCFLNYNVSLREVKERERTPFEKIVWLLMFTLCFLYCACLIWQSYTKWKNSPTIVMLTENDIRIWEIPFPAVTVCPERKILSKMFTFEEYFERLNNESNNIPDILKSKYEDVSLICGEHVTKQSGRNFSLGIETVRNIVEVSPKLYRNMKRCTWKGNIIDCHTIFKTILTDEGICYTFNTIGPEDFFERDKLNKDYNYMTRTKTTKISGWTLDKGYSATSPVNVYPLRTTSAGAKAGLRLTLTEMEKGLDLDCNLGKSGFKILLHHPSEFPRPSQQYIRVAMFEEITLTLTPKVVVTSDGLRGSTSSARHCYFKEERKLEYFKMYSQSNCQLECLTNFTYARCDCVHFSMPRTPNMSVCNDGRRQCVNNAESVSVELSAIELEGTLEKQSGHASNKEAIEIAKNCKCLPACSSVTYETETSHLALDYHKRTITQPEYGYWFMRNEYRRFRVSHVLIFFKSGLFDRSKRSELYTVSDILANCGGILGLFMGFSVINMVEALYFCILRIYRQRREHRKKHANTNEQVVENLSEKY